MLYDLRLLISYAYDRPAGAGRQLLRLLPAEVPGIQSCRAAQLTIRPRPEERTDFTDFFGTRVTEIVLPSGHDKVEFEARARVECLTKGPEFDISPPLAALAAEATHVADLSSDAPHHFIAPSPRIAADPAIEAFARDAALGTGSARATLAAVGLALHETLAFDAEATTVETLPAEAFARRSGVCQDFAQIMIAGLRALGMPAAYVSGYLRTEPPPGQPRLEGADAMHAWVRAWCGREAGWIDYDPTNACFADADHIRVGFGRDYGDVAPVAGILRLSGGQTSRQQVDVVPVG